MKIRWISITALAFTVLLGAGCATNGVDEGADGAAGGSGGAGAGGDGSAETAGIGAGGDWAGSSIDDPNSPLYNKTIYFDYDVSEIQDQYLDTLRAHANYLSRTPNVTVTIEGHCDERGSREYNISLGERRANAIQMYLQAEGVDASQISTLSYGEERPDDPGHSEAAWAMNRRAVIVY